MNLLKKRRPSSRLRLSSAALNSTAYHIDKKYFSAVKLLNSISVDNSPRNNNLQYGPNNKYQRNFTNKNTYKKPRPISAANAELNQPVTVKSLEKISFYNSSVTNFKTVNKILKDINNDATMPSSIREFNVPYKQKKRA